MSIIEAVRAYVLEFPGLHENAPVQVDYLGSEGNAYTIEPMPGDPVYRRYTDGGCLKQLNFLFASREYYSPDVEQCAAHQAFYEDFERWVTKRDAAGDFPELGDDRHALRMEVLTGGYAFSEEADTARYQIQLRLIYEEE